MKTEIIPTIAFCLFSILCTVKIICDSYNNKCDTQKPYSITRDTQKQIDAMLKNIDKE